MAFPITLQNMLSMGLNLLDTVMIGSLGELEVAAVSIANRLVNFFLIVIFGLTSGFAVFMSQYYGAGDMKNMKKLLGFDILAAFVISAVFSAIYYFFAENLIILFIRDTPQVTEFVVQTGARYLRIIVLSLIVNGVCYSIELMCRSVRLATVPMISAVFAVGSNAFLNYIFIFGKLGIPAMGSAGAAYATVIARVLQLVLTVMLVRLSKKNQNPFKASLKELCGIKSGTVKALFKTSAPVLINESMWSLAQTYFVAIVGELGASSVTVIQIVTNINNFMGALFIGIGSACSVFVANEIGAGRFNYAKSYSKLFLKLFYVLAGIVLILTIALRRQVMGWFALEADTYHMLDLCIVVSAAAMFFGNMNYGYIIGIFRGGGDTKFCMLLEIVTLWLVGIPLTLVGVYVFAVPVYIAALFMHSENMLKFIACIFRYRSGKWLNKVI